MYYVPWLKIPNISGNRILCCAFLFLFISMFWILPLVFVFIFISLSHLLITDGSKRHLEFMPVSMLDASECNSTSHYSGFLSNDEICAQFSNPEGTPCFVSTWIVVTFHKNIILPLKIVKVDPISHNFMIVNFQWTV